MPGESEEQFTRDIGNKSRLLNRNKTNWKFILIIVSILAVLARGGILRVTILFHRKDLTPKTLKSIIKQASLTVDKFIDLL